MRKHNRILFLCVNDQLQYSIEYDIRAGVKDQTHCENQITLVIQNISYTSILQY